MKASRLFLVLLGVLILASTGASEAQAQASSASEVVAAVNEFRAAHGLPPLQVDPILMSVAQAHSDYQASIQTVTHTGPGGTRPIDRAYAAGFGGGATIFISENIAGGLNMSIQTAIYQYWQDDLHLHTMLNPAAVYIGAGVGTAGDYVYYTVDTGYIAGSPANPPPPTSEGLSSGPEVGSYDPFIISTPREDGAIIHIVGAGQTLTGIANTYQVPLNEVLALNNLAIDATIYVGDEIIIRAGNTPTPTVSPTKPLPTPSPSATETVYKPSPTPRASFTPRPSATPTSTPAPPPMSMERARLVTAVVLLALGVFLVVVLGSMLKKP